MTRPALWLSLPNARKAAQLARGRAKAAKPGKDRRKPIRPVSKAQARRNRAYKVTADKFRLENPWCHGCARVFKVPTRPTTEVHHLRGRRGPLLIDVRFLIPLCSTCHRWTHDNPDTARRVGLICERGEWGKAMP